MFKPRTTDDQKVLAGAPCSWLWEQSSREKPRYKQEKQKCAAGDLSVSRFGSCRSLVDVELTSRCQSCRDLTTLHRLVISTSVAETGGQPCVCRAQIWLDMADLDSKCRQRRHLQPFLVFWPVIGQNTRNGLPGCAPRRILLPLPSFGEIAKTVQKASF